MSNMKPKKRQKMCHHCEGEVDLDVIVCPFCAADLREANPAQMRFNTNVSLAKHSAEHSLYPSAIPDTPQPLPREPVATEPQAAPAEAPSWTLPGWAAICLFSLGAQLLFLAIALLVLSEKGTLLLRFNAHFWPLCLLLAIPLLALGYRSSKL
jgi:hypothetical protein